MAPIKQKERYIAERPLRLFIPQSKILEYRDNGWAVRAATQEEIDAEFSRAAQVRITRKG